MAIVFLLVAVAVIVVAALMVTGRWSPALGTEETDGSGDRGPGAVDGVERFDVVLRGYRMDQVDETIEALRARVRHLESRS